MAGYSFGGFERRLRRLEERAALDSVARANAKAAACSYCDRRSGQLIVQWPAEDLLTGEDGASGAYANCAECSAGLPGELRPTILRVVYDPPLEEIRDLWR